jgi:K+-dependent Na+/Ca+ exchanger-like protein
MILILASLVLILSFYLLNEVTDKYFIPSLDKISHRLKMSDDAAGATFMAAGSSAPELFIAIIALIYGGENSDIGLGTIVGSALFNLLGIVGAVALVANSKLAWKPLLRDLTFYALSIAFLYWSLLSGSISWYNGIFFLLFYAVYVIVVIKWKNFFPESKAQIETTEEDEEESIPHWKKLLRPFDYLLEKSFPHQNLYITHFLLSVFFIALLSWALVESAIVISETLNVPKYIIALTILAFGTSVPDMMSSIIVAKQNRGGMAVSNAIGSNVFDILIGLGLPWLITIIVTGSNVFVNTSDISKHVAFLLLSVVFVLILIMINKWKLNRTLGFIILAAYLTYLSYTIYLGTV